MTAQVLIPADREKDPMMTPKSPVRILAMALLFLPLIAFGRQGTPPASRQFNAKALAEIKQFAVAETDPAAEKAADTRMGNPTPLRYAIPTPVEITPAMDGTWENVPGGRIWRLRVASRGATDLNFAFTTFWLPEGATLHISSESEDYFQGPYTHSDNKPHEQLWTPVVPGGNAVIELFVPDLVKEEPRIVLTRVNRGYRDMFRRAKDLDPAKASGACNIDVACSSADAWRNEIRSVARYSVGGSGLCTGTLVNNTAGDSRNLFLTANHCGLSPGNAASVVVYWNYQSPTCGQHGGGSLSQNQSSATFRAAKADVDMALIELDDVPDSLFRVYYAGWNRAGTIPTGAVGIHHPDGDVKAISFATTSLSTVNSCIGTGGSGTHWRVQWSSGTTEPGSSGSAIFDPISHQVIGFLSGGGASCETPAQPDCYGKLSVAWNNAGSSATRLSDWLDPIGSGASSVPGQNPPAIIITGAGSSLAAETCAPTNGAVDPGESVTVNFSLRNVGISNAASVTATLLATNGVTSPSAPQSYGTLSSNRTIVTRSFSFVASGACGSIVTPRLRLQSGTTDLGTVSFAFRMGSPVSSFTQRFDSVTAPALPVGWVNAASGGSTGWRTTTAAADTTPNSVFAPSPTQLSDSSLTSPTIAITNAAAQLQFRHRYDLEAGFDGGVLEIQIGGGTFTDIIAAGGTFVSGGYDFQISDEWGSAIALREAWTGDSGTFVTTVVALPPSAVGQNIRLRWRLATDQSEGWVGWYVDSVAIFEGYSCCRSLVAPQLVNSRNDNNKLIFSFDSLSGQSYVTEFQTALSTGVVWVPLQTNVGDGTRKSVTNVTGSAAQRFLRIKTQNVP
jgi:hypothetical protein